MRFLAQGVQPDCAAFRRRSGSYGAAVPDFVFRQSVTGLIRLFFGVLPRFHLFGFDFLFQHTRTLAKHLSVVFDFRRDGKHFDDCSRRFAVSASVLSRNGARRSVCFLLTIPIKKTAPRFDETRRFLFYKSSPCRARIAFS